MCGSNCKCGASCTAQNANCQQPLVAYPQVPSCEQLALVIAEQFGVSATQAGAWLEFRFGDVK